VGEVATSLRRVGHERDQLERATAVALLDVDAKQPAQELGPRDPARSRRSVRGRLLQSPLDDVGLLECRRVRDDERPQARARREAAMVAGQVEALFTVPGLRAAPGSPVVRRGSGGCCHAGQDSRCASGHSGTRGRLTNLCRVRPGGNRRLTPAVASARRGRQRAGRTGRWIGWRGASPQHDIRSHHHHPRLLLRRR